MIRPRASSRIRRCYYSTKPAPGELAARLERADFRVAGLDDKPFTSKPSPPFTTSTLQQEANRKLGFTAKRTMQVAQSLYENGHITYMRTDSTNLASVAIEAARELVLTQYGKQFLPEVPAGLPDQSQKQRKKLTRPFARRVIRSSFPKPCAASSITTNSACTI